MTHEEILNEILANQCGDGTHIEVEIVLHCVAFRIVAHCVSDSCSTCGATELPCDCKRKFLFEIDSFEKLTGS
jgi:hypothetical protein